MICIRFLVFFYDEKEDRHHRLAAVTPLFSSPSAVKTLMKTAKFDSRPALVVTGEKNQLEKLVKQVERLDVTEWLAIETWEPLKEKLTETVNSLEGLSVYEAGGDEQIVLGQVVVAAKKYPVDLPPENQNLWDEIYKLYRPKIKGDEDHKAAVHRRLYTEIAKKKGLVPWTLIPQAEKRQEIIDKLVEGEAKAHTLIAKLVRHATSEGLIKKAKSVQFQGADQDSQGISRYCLVHTLCWTLTQDDKWRSLVDYLLKKEAFHQVGPRMLKIKINQLTDLEIYGANFEKTVTLQICHRLTEAQTIDLIGVQVSNPIRELNRMGQLWHDKGVFPS